MSKPAYSLFQVTGIELEYMIVDRQSLNIVPICDELLKKVSGEITADFENGAIAWSNELVTHVVELKTNGPVNSLQGLSEQFHENIKQINQLLEPHNAILMPTGAHPWMNPFNETRIWPHEHNEIYSLYNRIFDCRGHGWSNLQSMHINLPFANDEEFGLLHAAIRVLMPIMPALSASTPVLDGKVTGYLDARMETYRHNQKQIPSIAGSIIPEAVYSHQQYRRVVFDPIIRDIKPFDSEGILDKHFLNSRGAIARFDRGAIEIRVLDLQESPLVDLAIAQFIIETLKWLIQTKKQLLVLADGFETSHLSAVFLAVIKDGEAAFVTDSNYLHLWGISETEVKSGAIWQVIFNAVKARLPHADQLVIEMILREGTLATRILRAIGSDTSKDRLKVVYEQLIDALKGNQMFRYESAI